MSSEVDLLDSSGGVRIITVHQAKGLEFDDVFVPGLAEDGFPSYFAKRDGKLEEERRLLYVDVTRALRQLFLTSHQVDAKGWRRAPSRFLGCLD